MNPNTILRWFTILPLIWFFACMDRGVDVRNLELVNTNWKLESFETIGVGRDMIRNGRVYSISFLPDSSARARADCNDCTATYETFTVGRDGQIVLTALSCTKRYCGEESLDWRFLDGLRRATTYTVNGNTLRIYYDEKKQVLNFIAQF